MTKTTAQDRRIAFLHEIAKPINDYVTEHGQSVPDDSPLLDTYFDRLFAEAPAMGRTERWQAAIEWHRAMLDEGHSKGWIVLQGSVHLSYANL